MELGRGDWVTADDVARLRERMYAHMEHYERIFSLRRLSRTPIAAGAVYWYELVEIPKELLLRSATSPIVMKIRSTQTPTPASCCVRDDAGRQLYELYFDAH